MVKMDVVELQEKTAQDDTRMFHVCDPLDFQNLKQLYDPALKFQFKEFQDLYAQLEKEYSHIAPELTQEQKQILARGPLTVNFNKTPVSYKIDELLLQKKMES